MSQELVGAINASSQCSTQSRGIPLSIIMAVMVMLVAVPGRGNDQFSDRFYLRKIRFRLIQLRMSRFRLKQLRMSRFQLEQLRMSRFRLEQLRMSRFRLEQLRMSRFRLEQLRKVGTVSRSWENSEPTQVVKKSRKTVNVCKTVHTSLTTSFVTVDEKIQILPAFFSLRFFN